MANNDPGSRFYSQKHLVRTTPLTVYDHGLSIVA